MRVMVFSLRIARILRLSEEQCQRICRAAYLHDVGRIAVSSSILRKSGALTREECAAMRVHPVISRELLGAFLCTEDLAGIALSHRERYDGQGYPQHQPLRAGLASVQDVAPWVTAPISRSRSPKLRDEPREIVSCRATRRP